MDYWKRANEIKDSIIAHRRFIHENAEVSLDTVKTADYISNQLIKLNYHPNRIIENGITATIGSGNGKTILLRADMDALPITEESGEPFACKTGAAHACGHDLHAAMLLGAATLLKENESEIEGTIKLMFQPGEETFLGAKAMIEAGILKNPTVDAALGYHVGAGKMPIGIHLYNDKNSMMYSNDGFKIIVKGKGAHGAYPNQSIDPINIAVHIYLGLQEIIAREVPSSDPCTLTIGSFHSGIVGNAIPDTAELQGSIRTTSRESRTLMINRIKEIAVKTAQTYRGTAEIEMISTTPPLICDPTFTSEILHYMSELPVPGQTAIPDMQASASDDFATILERVPGCYMFLSAGFPDKDVAPSHNPRVIFNEDVLPIGAAYLAHCATQWLKHNK
jgi:amidohydrolase